MIELPVMFVLEGGFPSYGKPDDLYSVCGQCIEISESYPLETWTCSASAPITDGKVTVITQVYADCDFRWKWRNRMHDNSKGSPHFEGYELATGKNREFDIDSGCDVDELTKFDVKWDATDKSTKTRNCIYMPLAPASATTESTPSDLITDIHTASSYKFSFSDRSSTMASVTDKSSTTLSVSSTPLILPTTIDIQTAAASTSPRNTQTQHDASSPTTQTPAAETSTQSNQPSTYTTNDDQFPTRSTELAPNPSRNITSDIQSTQITTTQANKTLAAIGWSKVK